ncbi:hypothetical protein KBB08_02785 [Candidatus Gracilibacteria bacterium]|nr:hypothetical protein [Candidatus Gracilibacteria bacterium]
MSNLPEGNLERIPEERPENDRLAIRRALDKTLEAGAYDRYAAHMRMQHQPVLDYESWRYGSGRQHDAMLQRISTQHRWRQLERDGIKMGARFRHPRSAEIWLVTKIDQYAVATLRLEGGTRESPHLIGMELIED